MENDIRGMIKEYQKTKMFDIDDLVKAFYYYFESNTFSLFQHDHSELKILKMIRDVLGEEYAFNMSLRFSKNSCDTGITNRIEDIVSLSTIFIDVFLEESGEAELVWDQSNFIKRYSKSVYEFLIGKGPRHRHVYAHTSMLAYNYCYNNNKDYHLLLDVIKESLPDYYDDDVPSKYTSLNMLYVYYVMHKIYGRIKKNNYTIPSSFKGVPGKARGCYYAGYISSGQADKSFVRKVRSDHSAYASALGLFALYEHRALYNNYEELLILFHDTRHRSVGGIISKITEPNLAIYFAGNPLVPGLKEKLLR